MKYNFKRMDLTIAREFVQPAFDLHEKGPLLLGNLYSALHSRFPIRLDDLKSEGGTSFGDIKVTVVAFEDNAQIVVYANGYKMDFFNLINSFEDVVTLQNFAETAEKSIQEVLSNSELAGRVIQGRAWIDCEGGAAAVKEMLENLGTRALDLSKGNLSDFSKHYSIGVSGDDENGRSMKIGIERSNIQIGDLYIDATFTFDSVESKSTQLTDHISTAKNNIEELLTKLGLNYSAGLTS